MKTFLKVLAICSLIWFGAYLLTMGVLTTVIVLSVFLLLVSLCCLFGGIWLGLSLLKRNTDAALRVALVVLIPLGLAILFTVLFGTNWFKGF